MVWWAEPTLRRGYFFSSFLPFLASLPAWAASGWGFRKMNAAPPPPLPLHPIRLEEFDKRLESQPSRYTFAGTDPRALRRLIARLGFTSAQRTVEQLTAAFLDQSVCTDDATFARHAYWALVGRDIGEPYARWLAAHWKDRRERARLIRGLIETPEFPVRRAK